MASYPRSVSFHNDKFNGPLLTLRKNEVLMIRRNFQIRTIVLGIYKKSHNVSFINLVIIEMSPSLFLSRLNTVGSDLDLASTAIPLYDPFSNYVTFVYH
jgi:uncharacterized membrane protein